MYDKLISDDTVGDKIQKVIIYIASFFILLQIIIILTKIE